MPTPQVKETTCPPVGPHVGRSSHNHIRKPTDVSGPSSTPRDSIETRLRNLDGHGRGSRTAPPQQCMAAMTSSSSTASSSHSTPSPASLSPSSVANTIICLSHFCEIHGPQSILSTRLYPTNNSGNKDSHGRRNGGGSNGGSGGGGGDDNNLPFLPQSETGTSCANCSYNIPSTPTTPPLRSVFSASQALISSRTTSSPLLNEASVRALSIETLAKGQQSGSFVVNTELAVLGNAETRTLNVVHVFRIVDPRARGQRRAYAFLAIGDRSLWRWQARILRGFEAWAGSIVGLAEEHLRALREGRGDDGVGGVGGGVGTGTGGLETPPLSSSVDLTSATPSPPMSIENPTPPEWASPPKFPSPLAQRHQRVLGSQTTTTTRTATVSGGSASGPGGSSNATPAANIVPAATSSTATPTATATATTAHQRGMTPVSSFLSAKTIDPDGYPRPRSALGVSNQLLDLPKTRTLAEIVGDEFFFVRLHAEFCGLIRGLVEGSGGVGVGEKGEGEREGKGGMTDDGDGEDGDGEGSVAITSDCSGEYDVAEADFMASWAS